MLSFLPLNFVVDQLTYQDIHWVMVLGQPSYCKALHFVALDLPSNEEDLYLPLCHEDLYLRSVDLYLPLVDLEVKVLDQQSYQEVVDLYLPLYLVDLDLSY